MEQRDPAITVMKALAIVCMVSGHAFTGTQWEWLVGMFHMPLFFFCSGYCFKERYLSDGWCFVRRKMRTLWWPTFLWVGAMVLLHNILIDIGLLQVGSAGPMAVHRYDWTDTARYLLMATLLHSHAPVFAGVWFIKALIVANLMGFVLIRHGRGPRLYIHMVTMLALSIAMTALIHQHIPVIDFAHVPFLSTFFLLAGYAAKRARLFDRIGHLPAYAVGLPCAALLLCGYCWWPSNMLLSITAPACVPYGLSALSGIVLMYLLSRILLRCTAGMRVQAILEYMGNHTYSILMMHALCFKLVSLLLIYVYALPHSHLADFPVIHHMAIHGYALAYTAVGIALPLAIHWGYRQLCHGRCAQ